MTEEGQEFSMDNFSQSSENESESEEESGKTDNEESVKDKTPSQKDLDWRNFKSEDLKKNESLLRYKTLDDLGNAYLSLERKLGSDRLRMDKERPVETGTALRKTLDLKEGDYPKEDFPKELRESALKYGIGPKALKEFRKTYDDYRSVKENKEFEKRQEGWRAELLKGKDKKDFEASVRYGLKQIGLKYEQFKEIFGKETLNPKIIGFVEKLGIKARSEEPIKILEGKSHGNLPSDLGVLNEMFKRENKLKNEARSKQEFEKADRHKAEIAKIHAKIMKIQRTRNDAPVGIL